AIRVKINSYFPGTLRVYYVIPKCGNLRPPDKSAVVLFPQVKFYDIPRLNNVLAIARITVTRRLACYTFRKHLPCVTLVNPPFRPGRKNRDNPSCRRKRYAEFL